MRMAICPTCGASIESLEEDCVVTTLVGISKSGSLIQMGKPERDEEDTNYCPDCREPVCDKKENAVAFLQGR